MSKSKKKSEDTKKAKKKKESHKSSKHHRHDHHKKERKSHSHKHHSRSRKREFSDTDSPGREKVEQINEDDYFLKNEEFRVWLHVNKSISFESLDSAKARDIFSNEFCNDWNRGRLPPMYYEGTIPLELRHRCAKTNHEWGIKLNEKEKERVSDLTYKVDASTRKNFDGAWVHMAADNHQQPAKRSSKVGHSTQDSKKHNDSGDRQLQREEDLEDERSARKRRRYHENENAKAYLDEIAPKATGREAQIDKRKEVGAKIKGAALDRENARDGLELSEDVTMGGGDDFASVKARLDRSRQRKIDHQQERLRELQEKEKDKNKNFLDQLGIDFSKGPIKIQPR